MTAGPRQALARAAPAPELYNSQTRASDGVDDMVNDAVGTLRRAWRRPRAAGLGAPVVGAGASEHHLAFSSRVEWFRQSRVQWFSQCLAMLSLGAVELVVPNTQGAGIMAPPFVSAEFLASSLAMLLLLTPRLAGDRPGASDAIAPRLAVAAHGGDVARIPDGAPPTTSTFVPAAAPCDPGLAPLLSTPPQRAAADSVIPKLPPHVLAFRELPASAARRAIRLLEAVIKRRRAHVLQVLLNHAVPDELCDPYNLLCGLKGVTFVVEAEGDAAGRGFWRYELKLFNVSTKASRVEASSLALLLSKVDAFSVLNSPESLVSAMAVTSNIPASTETEPMAALELTSSTPQAAPPPESAVLAVIAAGMSSALLSMSRARLSAMPVVAAVPWPAPSEPVQPAKAPPSPRPERLPGFLKAYLLCCTCANAARGAAAALGVPPLADACWMDDDELVNELHELLSHEVLFVYVRWMVVGRLVQVAPPSATLESLMSRAQTSSYRLPLLAFAAACSHLWRDRKSVQGTDSPVCSVQLKANDNYGPGRISAMTLANYFSELRGWARGEMATVVLDERVVEALSFARRELRLAPIASTPPLVHSIVRAAFEQLTAKHDWELRLALWLVLAVAL
eukprot:jgi/Chrpa1/21669/Chrysochromulina_OHIO_Genome00026480-RA